MAAGAAIETITSIAYFTRQRAKIITIEKSKGKVRELNLAYKSIEGWLKYNLGNATEGSFVKAIVKYRKLKMHESQCNKHEE